MDAVALGDVGATEKPQAFFPLHVLVREDPQSKADFASQPPRDDLETNVGKKRLTIAKVTIVRHSGTADEYCRVIPALTPIV